MNLRIKGNSAGAPSPSLRRWRAFARLGCFSLAVLIAGCTAAHYRKSADKETYRAIAQKSQMVTNMESHFTIEQTNRLDLEGLPVVTGTNAFLGEAATAETGARVLSLEKALAIAIKHSRAYQNNKEQLYLTALSLTLTRHQFTPLLSASGSGAYEGETEQSTGFKPDPVTGEPIPVLSDKLSEKHDVRLGGESGADWLIRDVGRISAAFTTDFLRFLEGDPRTVTSSELGATFTRPLLRNSGFKQEMEELTQAERDLLYALRGFVLFRKNFSVQIASAYYGVLSDRDAARNGYLNLQSSKKSGERTRALAAEGRTTQTDLGRIEQQELSAESAWVTSIRTYQRALDDFKFQLGIPVETKVVLDDAELEQLKIHHPHFTASEAIRIALAARPDYQNALDEVADSERKVKLAADRLKPQLDFVANAGISGDPGAKGFAVPNPNRYNYSFGANFDLPLDRKAERNGYRSALISEEHARRSAEQQRDQIELDIRDSWRLLEQARRNYEISEVGVQIAQRRVEEQELLAELGRAKALDEVDAQNALLSSKDQRTAALVSHTIARLQFWANMGILYIKDNGQWQEFDE
ncbi:MAG TPA: TolC family protein [Verrucomicrobiae bacterium]|nr:TolC family protein [Verrucomicrobiae bacterium]